MSAALPAINRLVVLRDGNGDEYRSRVEDADGRWLVVARPLDLRGGHNFDEGEPLIIGWPDERGLRAVAARLRETRTENALKLWVIETQGEVWTEQRRNFVRIEVGGQVELTPAAPGPASTSATVPGQPLAARLINVSEAAMRCALPDAHGAELAPGLELSVEFTVSQAAFTLTATVFKSEPSARQAGLEEFVLTFQTSEDQAAALRRMIFAEQIKLRNGARAS